MTNLANDIHSKIIVHASSFLSKQLDTQLISVQAEISSRKKLLEEMAHLLTIPLAPETKEKDVYHYLLEREKLGNTGIGNGVAIPHSRCSQTDKAIIAIITLQKPIDYDSMDRQPVDVAFGLLVPQDAAQEHLNLLSDIARIFSNNHYKAELLAASSPSQIIALIDKWSVAEQ